MTAISLEVIIVSPKKPQNNNKISNSFGACHERDYKVIILFKRLQGWHNKSSSKLKDYSHASFWDETLRKEVEMMLTSDFID